jgi:hypothetical protein
LTKTYATITAPITIADVINSGFELGGASAIGGVEVGADVDAGRGIDVDVALGFGVAVDVDVGVEVEVDVGVIVGV